MINTAMANSYVSNSAHERAPALTNAHQPALALTNEHQRARARKNGVVLSGFSSENLRFVLQAEGQNCNFPTLSVNCPIQEATT